MFSRQKSPVKKKFAKAAAPKKYRRSLDPRTVVLLKQGFLGLGLLLVAFLMGVLVWYGTRVDFLTISTVTVSGGETINHTEVRSAVDTVLAGEYIGLIPRRFAWLYPESEVLAVVASIPRVKDPQVTAVNGREIAITFTEYIPYALWCTDRTSNECLFIDESGFAFTKAPQLSGGAFPRFHTIGTTPTERTTMVPVADLRAIEVIRERISVELALPIAYVETDIMRDVFLGVAGGGEIKATLRMSSEETFENLRTVLSAEEFKDIAPGSFQYIDLRFGNKVFVNEEKPGVATSTPTTTEESVLPTEDVAEPTPTEVTEVEVTEESSTSTSSLDIVE
jgi:hypothetical protein